jgi:hypothetical protein
MLISLSLPLKGMQNVTHEDSMRCSICGTLILKGEVDTQRLAIYRHYTICHPDIIALLSYFLLGLDNMLKLVSKPCTSEEED